jgi:hypothetical protein
MEPNQQNTPAASSSGGNPQAEFSASVENAKVKLSDVAEPVKEKAIEVAQQQRDVGADQLGIVARAVHGAASELEKEMPQVAGYVHDAGKRLESAASRLRDGNVEDMMDKFGQFARNQPATVFGGAMLAGFALTRFLKASAKTPHTANPMQGGSA